MPKLCESRVRSNMTISGLVVLSWLSLGGAPGHTQTVASASDQSTSAATSTSQSNSVIGKNHKVDVLSVMDVTSAGRMLHQISYTYSFSGVPSVYIRGIGLTTSSGSFSYMTGDPTLQFYDSQGGSLLAEVVLHATAIAMGSDSMELPDIPPADSPFRDGDWKPELTFPAAISAIIQKYFGGGYNIRDVGKQHYYLTTFRTLRVSDPQLVSQIALVVSQPYDVTGHQMSYRVQYVIRDRPRMSATFTKGNDTHPVTQSAAIDFLNTFLSDVANQGAHK